MACDAPLRAYRHSDGSVTFTPAGADSKIDLPCGQCTGCRLERSRQWAVRCMHEAQMHLQNCFITLTYNDANFPTWGNLNHDHFQDFIRKLRKHLAPKTLRYYMCGEYTEDESRPHYHACLFGHAFYEDRTFWKSENGNKLYRSPTLEKIWDKGFSLIGELTFESAAYVARYVMKKITGEKAYEHYGHESDHTTGEIRFIKEPEYNKMSLKPGIGATWYEHYKHDIYPHGKVIVNGKKQQPPRYYNKKWIKQNPDYEQTKLERAQTNWAQKIEDNIPSRLEVKKHVRDKQIETKKRDKIK